MCTTYAVGVGVGHTVVECWIFNSQVRETEVASKSKIDKRSPWYGISPSERERRLKKMQMTRAMNRLQKPAAESKPHNGPVVGATTISMPLSSLPIKKPGLKPGLEFDGYSYDVLGALIVTVWHAMLDHND